jgi:hypothetical protein
VVPDTNTAVDLRRPRSVVEIIGDALACYGRYPLVFGVLALAVVAPYSLLVLAVTGASPFGAQHVSAGTVLTLLLLDVLLMTPLISALLVHALVEIGEGRRPRPLEVARRGVKVLPVVAAAEVVAGIGIALGLLVFVIPGVILAIRWAVVAQSAATENVDWLGALRRSGELTAGNYLHVLGVIFAVSLIEFGIQQAGGALAGTGANAGQFLLGILVVTITRSFAALTTAFLFFDLLARQAGAGGPGGWP